MRTTQHKLGNPWWKLIEVLSNGQIDVDKFNVYVTSFQQCTCELKN